MDEATILGWVAKALDLLEEVDPYTMSDEWLRDVQGLRVRLYNKVNGN